MSAEVIRAKRIANRREYYVKSLERYLLRFSEGIGNKEVKDITSYDIEGWISKFPTPYSRQTWLNRISALFSYAVRRKIRPDNPCAAVERVSIDRKAPLILSVDKAKELLEWCPTAFKPYLILAMFVGVRPYEIERLDWTDINLETKTVRINKAKVQSQRRIVPIEPIVSRLLSNHPIQTGKICPSSSTMKKWKRQVRNILGFDAFPKDIFRHTAGSYMYELYQNVEKVAKFLGNSPTIFMRHYCEPVGQTAMLQFWQLDQPITAPNPPASPNPKPVV